MCWVRFFDFKSARRMWKKSATVFWIDSTSGFASGLRIRSCSACRAKSTVIADPLSEASAASRVRHPSSSRTFDETLCAIYIATSGAIRDQSRLEPIAQPVLEPGDFAWNFVRSQNDLMPLGVKRVESMEEFFLGALASGQELHVVEDQRIDPAKFLAELAHLVAAQRIDHLVHENFGRHEQHFPRPVATGPDMVPDCGHQVGLAQAHPAINEKRVVFLARLVGDRLRRGMRELIGRSHHELRETVARVQARMPISTRRGCNR